MDEVTAETLTREQIREHLAWLQSGQYRLGEGPRAGLDKRAAVNDCIMALRAPPHWPHLRPAWESDRDAARERIAAAINARAKGGGRGQ